EIQPTLETICQEIVFFSVILQYITDRMTSCFLLMNFSGHRMSLKHYINSVRSVFDTRTFYSWHSSWTYINGRNIGNLEALGSCFMLVWNSSAVSTHDSQVLRQTSYH
ncbi:unnamed protein product, partial [Heterobilharzia americana]